MIDVTPHIVYNDDNCTFTAYLDIDFDGIIRGDVNAANANPQIVHAMFSQLASLMSRHFLTGNLHVNDLIIDNQRGEQND